MNDSEKQNLTAWLDQLVLQAVPEATRVSKYGGTLYTLFPAEKERQFCGIFAYKAHVQLAIGRGPELDDPQQLLQGQGKTRRHINFTSETDTDERPIIQLLKSAARLSTHQADSATE